MAVVPSSGSRGEALRLTAAERGRRTESRLIALDPWEAPQPLASAERRHGGRVLRLRWVSGFEPLAAVDVASGRTAARVKVSELYPPSFADDGTPVGIAAIAIGKCVRITLPTPLAGRRVIDARTGRTLRPPPAADPRLPSPPRARRCPQVPSARASIRPCNSRGRNKDRRSE